MMTAMPATLDLSEARPTPFRRLVRIELRKMIDTRAGFWLMVSIAAVTALVLVIQLVVIATQHLTVDFGAFMIGMNTPMGILLPVLGVLTVTSEWSQRTAMTTFALEPSRMRVLWAKVAAVCLVAVAAVVVGLLLASIANLLYGAITGKAVVWGLTWVKVVAYFLLHQFGMLTGFAFGVVLLNSPTAIVLYFVYNFILPLPFEIASNLVAWWRHLRPWIDFAFAQNPLIRGHPTGEDWAHLVTSGLLWLVLPLAFGIWRVLRAEVK